MQNPLIYRKLLVICAKRMDEEYYADHCYFHQFCQFIAFHELYELSMLLVAEKTHNIMNLGVPKHVSTKVIQFSENLEYRYSHSKHKLSGLLNVGFYLESTQRNELLRCFVDPQLGTTTFYSLLNCFNKFYPFFVEIVEFATDFNPSIITPIVVMVESSEDDKESDDEEYDELTEQD